MTSSRRVGGICRATWRCEEKMNESAKHWQCDSEVQPQEEKPWRNERLGKFAGAGRNYKAAVGVGCNGFRPRFPSELSRETREEVVKFLEKVEQCEK